MRVREAAPEPASSRARLRALLRFPLVYKCLHVSETLVSSVISKGIEADCEKTSYRSLSFGLLDGAALGVGVVLLGVAVWM